MYSTSTQKKDWTFADQEQIDSLRAEANDSYKKKYRPFLESPDEEEHFLTPMEEALLCKIVTQTGIRFGDDFRPAMWPSVRWTAFAYFKRFYLHQSAMEYFPKNVMMACYYLASKVDEFNVTIDQFVGNLRNGVRENNIETILTLEPELMLKLDYQLTVHCPFRPFEGHVIDMKTKCELNFDLELIRPHSTEFFTKALVGDAMLLFPPSQMALAALSYALERLGKSPDLLKNYLMKLLEIDAWSMNTDEVMMLEKLQIRLDAICKTVMDQAAPIDAPDQSVALQNKMQLMVVLQSKLSGKFRSNENSEPVDSDDEF